MGIVLLSLLSDEARKHKFPEDVRTITRVPDTKMGDKGALNAYALLGIKKQEWRVPVTHKPVQGGWLVIERARLLAVRPVHWEKNSRNLFLDSFFVCFLNSLIHELMLWFLY